MSTRAKFEKFPGYTKIQVESFVKMKISTDLKWAEHAVVKIFSLQTKNERKNHISVNKDNLGFTKYDAPYYSVLACKLRAKRKLSSIQERKLLKLNKYARQLISVCNRVKMQKALDTYYGN